jgi:hypothetical protein
VQQREGTSSKGNTDLVSAEVAKICRLSQTEDIELKLSFKVDIAAVFPLISR